ncbi:MAG: sirohydrochlorin cobaltochelatase [Phascolarctobacterium sp.]
MNKKALVVISFGSTFDDTRKRDIGGIEAALATAFPNYDQYRAFTSTVIRKRLAARGIFVDDTETVLQKLAQADYEEVVLQPTHLLHGEEFEQKVLSLREQFLPVFKRIIISKPLIVDPEDYQLAVAALLTQLPPLAEQEGVVFMGHGTPRANNAAHGYTYVKLQELFAAHKAPVLVGTVEDEDAPNFATLLAELQERGYKHVHLYPLMVVAGDHANNDMYSDEPDSWKSQIEALGIKTTGHLNGIGRFPAIQALYIQHVLQALKADK